MAVFFQVGAGNWTFTVLVKPMTEEFNATHSQFVGALTAAAMLGAVASPLIGRIVDRYGARVVITACLLFFGLMLILTSRISALWQFYLFYSVGMGLAQSGVLMVGGQVVAANWFIRKRGIAFATLFAATSATGVVFTLIAQEIVDWRDWRMVWLTMGLAIILVPAPLAWLVIKRRPEDIGSRPDGDTDTAPASRGEASRGTRNPLVNTTEVIWTLREATRTRTFWLLNFSLLLITFPGAGVITVMHPYFTDEGISSGRAAQLVSFYAFSSLLGTVFWGILAQLLSVRGLLVPWALSYGASITLLVLVGGSSVPLIYLTLFPLGISVI
ncbi:MAG: MFS transporter, partial [Dehalococcoidia bacterium]|nr:MFS transporter [Dehalococcoidia bacterium]